MYENYRGTILTNPEAKFLTEIEPYFIHSSKNYLRNLGEYSPPSLPALDSQYSNHFPKVFREKINTLIEPKKTGYYIRKKNIIKLVIQRVNKIPASIGDLENLNKRPARIRKLAQRMIRSNVGRQSLPLSDANTPVAEKWRKSMLAEI